MRTQPRSRLSACHRTSAALGASLSLLLALAAAQPADAETATGKVTPGRSPAFAFLPTVDGQALVTLTWAKKAADFFLVMSCGEGDDELVWGVSAALLDRLQSLSAGVLGGSVCTVGVFSLKGSSKIQLNVAVASSEPLAKTSAALEPIDPTTRPRLLEAGEKLQRALRGKARRRSAGSASGVGASSAGGLATER